ncbi:MAG: hypothetical protein JWM16_4830 [Verrucomicrobiales bacterium]|nr:hypothetical protein [Verrucomicrobiales bacterium]
MFIPQESVPRREMASDALNLIQEQRPWPILDSKPILCIHRGYKSTSTIALITPVSGFTQRVNSSIIPSKRAW